MQAAIAERSSAILTVGLGGRAERCYTSFVHSDATRDRLCLALPRDERSGEPLVLQPGESTGVSFRLDRRRYFFACIVVGVERGGWRDGEGVITARWPSAVSRMQRRVYERVVPPVDERIQVYFGLFDGAEDDSRTGSAVGRCSGVLQDMSVGGCRVRADSASGLELGAVARCVLGAQCGSGPLRLDARLRHVQCVRDGTQSLGFEFSDLSASAEGRCRMAHLASLAAQFRASHGA